MDMLIVLVQLMGGLGLFLYGMKLMGDGLENAAGEGLKSILEKVTGNKIMAVLIGAVVTAVIQSSSATTVMVVGFVNAGLMSLAQAAGIIMGANIGTTITAQLVSFKLDQIAPLFLFAGVVLIMTAKAKRSKEIGNIILGFGILFTGMGTMSSAMKPLTNSVIFRNMLISVGNNWFLGSLAGMAITAVLQSSSATTGILIALAGAGLIDVQTALPIVFGCNIGTCITAMIASVGTNKTAHKAALLHLIFNVVGTIIFIPFLRILAKTVITISPDDVSRQIANAHTIFNIINTIILLPFTSLIIKAVNFIIPGEAEKEETECKYIDDRLLETPVIAVGQVIKETIRMAEKAKQNFELSMEAFLNNDNGVIEKVYANEEIINMLEQNITEYLVKLSKCELSNKEKEIVTSTIHIIIDIERIGDHAENIVELAEEKINKNLTYSDKALEQLKEIFTSTLKAIDISIAAYSQADTQKAKEIYSVEEKIDKCKKDFREDHLARLYAGECNVLSGTLFMDLITSMERIGDHATNISESVIGCYT